MKKILAAAAGATALALLAVPAQANVSYAGNYTYLGAFAPAQSETATRGPMADGTAIADYWIFDFSPSGSTSFSVNFNPSATIVGASGALFAVTTNNACVIGAVCASTIGGLIASANTTAGNTVLDFTNIAAGRYAMFYAGTVSNSFDDTNYSGQINFRVAKVPEPGTLALFGLGLVGLAMGRRRS